MNRAPSEIVVDGDIAYISLRNRAGDVVAKAVIDACFVDVVRGRRWYQTSHGYCAEKRGSITYLHRLIVSGKCIDHIDGDRLNNRASNLRSCDHSHNLQNTGAKKNSKTGVKGVHRYKGGNKYASQITKDRKVYSLGVFDTIEQAKAAYDNKAKELFGNFAKS